jgi:hypothetical protein
MQRGARAAAGYKDVASQPMAHRKVAIERAIASHYYW